jgi:hypothetical protein
VFNRSSRLAFVASLKWAEDVIVIAAAAVATLRAEWRIVTDPLVFQTDAQIHEFWMRRFQDSALFDDPLTNALVDTGYSPPGFRLLSWLASHVLDPVLFAEMLPLALQPLSVWLVFRIVGEHVDWRPAAWLAAGLFLVPWDILRFSGGHPRAFAHAVVLLTVYLLLRRRDLAAALIPAVGLLLYPPAGISALAIVLVAAFERGQRFLVNRTRAVWAALGLLAFALTALAIRLLTGPSQELISEGEARSFPEFGQRGQVHFFADSTLQFLKQNYSGFALRDSGSILAVAALGLLILRFRNVTLLRWEIWCMAIASLALFGIAHALLFLLYLPHRYTYPLLPFFCITIGVCIRPTFEAWAERTRAALVLVASPLAFALLALVLFPLGPQLSLSGFATWLADARVHIVAGVVLGLLLAAAVWAWTGRDRRRPAAAAAAAILAGTVLVAEVAFAGGGKSPAAATCKKEVFRYLRTLPKEAIIAGDPVELNCVPVASLRPVVISRKLYQPWDVDYFAMIRERMFRTVRGYYGPSVAALVDLRTRYGADYLLVRTPARARPWRGMAPFSDEFRSLRRSGAVPAALRLPEGCRTWERGQFAVYSLACVAAEQPG